MQNILRIKISVKFSAVRYCNCTEGIVLVKKIFSKNDLIDKVIRTLLITY